MTAEKTLNLIKQIGFYVENKPSAFGIFHLCWLAATVLAILFALKFYDKKMLNLAYTVTAVVMIIGVEQNCIGK